MADDSKIYLEGDPPISVVVRRSSRARRLSLRVSRLDGRVTLTLPLRAPQREGDSFLREKEGWIRAQLMAQPETTRVEIGGTLPFEGRHLTILPGQGRSIEVSSEAVKVPGNSAQTGRRLAAFLKHAARDRLAAASDNYAAQVGHPYGRITLRDTRSRWGSCSSKGDLMYSWRLIMAPPSVLAYVAAHEVAHLIEMNHSSAFWHVVEQLYPHYQTPRRWLRDHGAQLHAIRFMD